MESSTMESSTMESSTTESSTTLDKVLQIAISILAVFCTAFIAIVLCSPISDECYVGAIQICPGFKEVTHFYKEFMEVIAEGPAFFVMHYFMPPNTVWTSGPRMSHQILLAKTVMSYWHVNNERIICDTYCPKNSTNCFVTCSTY